MKRGTSKTEKVFVRRYIEVRSELVDFSDRLEGRCGVTNFANIKNMNIKQMAKFLSTLNGGGTVREEQFLKWLKEKKGGAE